MVEALLVQLLNSSPAVTGEGLEAFMDVPAERPIRFVTVERTGGPRDLVRDLPLIAVQVWAETRYEASRLAELVAEEIRAFIAHPRIGRIRVVSVHNFPDLEGPGRPRYQIAIELVTVK